MDIGPNTISRYLEHLQDAFIISEALRYDVKGRKYIGTETKYYFEDMGIRNAILDFRQIEFTHTMENVIYNELRRLGYGVDVGLVETMKRNAEGKTVRSNLEIDFVVNRHDERIYIQSAYALPDRLTPRSGRFVFIVLFSRHGMTKRYKNQIVSLHIKYR